MLLLRENSFTTIAGAPSWFLGYLAVHLSVPVEIGQRADSRFGSIFQRGDNWFGSLVLGNRVPAGLTGHVVAIARYYTQQGYEVLCEVRDVRVRPPDGYPWGSVRADWRPYQNEIHARAMQSGVGVIDAPPRSGKTLMAARAIDQLGQPTLYVAPAVAVVRQTYEVFVKHFGADLVSRVDGTADAAMRDLSKPIVVATAASAVTLSQEFFNTRQLLVVDEWHHGASATYHKLNALASSVYYRLCFTGTYWRTGLDMLALEALCSGVIAKVEIADLIPKYLAEPCVYFMPYRQAGLSARDWRDAYDKGIVECAGRNEAVSRLATQLAGSGVQTLVLVNRREHADALGAMIPDACVAKGGEGVLTGKTVKQFLAGQFPVLVGTSVLGEGVDVPNAGALIYAGGFGDSVQMMQSYFRPLTAHAGKARGLIYDFIDQHHPTLQRHSEDRLRLARKYLAPWVQRLP